MSERFDEFTARYCAELDANPEALPVARQVLEQGGNGTVTLLYSSNNPDCNHALVLKAYLEELSV